MIDLSLPKSSTNKDKAYRRVALKMIALWEINDERLPESSTNTNDNNSDKVPTFVVWMPQYQNNSSHEKKTSQSFF